MVRPHKTSAQEVGALFAVAERSLRDAGVAALSSDGRFLMAYTGAYQLSTIVLYATGYQAHGDDHHRVTFSVLPLALGSKATMISDYFDRCRRKRNSLQYDQAGLTSESEAEELIRKAAEFKANVIQWLLKEHPVLLPAYLQK